MFFEYLSVKFLCNFFAFLEKEEAMEQLEQLVLLYKFLSRISFESIRIEKQKERKEENSNLLPFPQLFPTP